MKRWRQDLPVTRKAWHLHRRGHVEFNKRRSQDINAGQLPPGSDPNQVDCPCDNQLGRFRKKDAYDCGRSRCQVCHGYKLPWREKSAKERLADFGFREQIREWSAGFELATEKTGVRH
jgi:hypothetical protein